MISCLNVGKMLLKILLCMKSVRNYGLFVHFAGQIHKNTK